MKLNTYISNLKRPLKIRLILICVFASILALLMLITFQYCDVNIYTVWSAEFWDCFFSGRLGDFYEYTLLDPRESLYNHACGASWLQLVPMFIWDFPAWLYLKITNQTCARIIPTIIWHKLLFIVFILLTAYIVYKISMLICDNIEKTLIAILFIAISPELLISTMYAGQDEIIYIFIFLVGLFYYLQNKKKLFLICAMITVTLNPIMLLFIIPLILLTQKKIFKIIFDLLLLFLPSLIFNVVYRNDSIYKENSAIGDIFTDIFNSSMSFSMNEYRVPAIILVFVFVMFFCYSQTKEDLGNKKIIWLLALLFMCFGMLMGHEYINYFYRSFLYVPFVAILFAISKQNEAMNCFLLTIFTYLKTFICIGSDGVQAMSTQYAMQSKMINAIASKTGIINNTEKITVYSKLTDQSEILSNTGLIAAIMIAVGIIFLFINFPGKYGEQREVKLESKKWVWIALYCLCMPLFLGIYYVILFS